MTKIVSDKISGFDLNGDGRDDFLTITKSIANDGKITTFYSASLSSDTVVGGWEYVDHEHFMDRFADRVTTIDRQGDQDHERLYFYSYRSDGRPAENLLESNFKNDALGHWLFAGIDIVNDPKIIAGNQHWPGWYR